MPDIPSFVWIIAAVAVVAIIAAIIVCSAKKKKKNKEKLTGVKTENDVRYSTNSATVHDDGSKASYIKDDFVVSKGRTIVAGKGNDVLAGKYTVLTTIDGVEAFNVRINGFVREIQHNSTIILGDGDTFCPVSHSVVLR